MCVGVWVCVCVCVVVSCVRMSVVCVASSHWYLAIICFPYLVSVQQTLEASTSVTGKQQSKEVVLCYLCNVS